MSNATNISPGRHPSAAVQPRARVLIVAFGLPPYAGIGAQRPLRLMAHMAEGPWEIDALTARQDAHLPGTPFDDRLLDKLPANARIVRTGAIRWLSSIGRLASPLRSWLRRRAAQPRTGSMSPSASSPRRVSWKTLVDELMAMPDRNVGWTMPAIVTGLLSFRKTRPDVVYSSGPPWTGHLVAGVLASLWRRPWVADFRDPWVRSPWGRYKTRTAQALGARLERLVVSRATMVVFTTDTAREEFATHYGDLLSGKFHTVANGCDPTEFENPAATAQVGDGPFVILHAGSLYGGRSPVGVIRAAAALCAASPALEKRLRLRFLGAAPDSQALRTCEALGIGPVVEFLPRVGRAESLAQMRDAGALLILQAGLNLAIPGKLYEYFAAGRPVLALCGKGELADLIERNGAGLVADPDDDEQIMRVMSRLLEGFEQAWVPPAPALFDGRLRAAETAALLAEAIAGGPMIDAADRRVLSCQR